jgi:putative addiction module component (TIGR02574 family)
VKLAELPAVLALSAKEKLELLDELLQSVAREIGSGISEEEKLLLDSRWAEHLAHPEKALTLDQFNEALDERLK